MKLNKNYKWIFGMLGITGLVVLPTTLTLTSCSKDDNYSSSIIQTYDVKFNDTNSQVSYFTNVENDSNENITPNRPSVLPFWPSDTSSENEIDPNFNQNAILEFLQLLESTVDKISNFAKNIIQQDLNDVVLDFLSVVENETNDVEIELTDRTDVSGDVITVNKVTIDNDFINTKKLILNLTVNYDKKIETKGHDIKETLTTTFDFPFYIEFVGQAELLTLSQKIQKHDANISGTNNEVDFKDIKEIFLGEKYKNDKDCWQNAFIDNKYEYDYDKSSLQQYGLINYVTSFNDNVSPNAKMLGYTFNIADFWDSLEKSINSSISILKNNDVLSQDLTYWAPSTSLNKIFMPNIDNLNSEYQLKINIDNMISTEGYNSFANAYSTLQNLCFNNIDNPKNVYLELNKVCNISLPENIINNLKSVKISPSTNLNDDDFEIKFKDNFGNKYEFDFYKTWWV